MFGTSCVTSANQRTLMAEAAAGRTAVAGAANRCMMLMPRAGVALNVTSALLPMTTALAGDARLNRAATRIVLRASMVLAGG
mmetsp:Transcript_1865/g.3975  ORF Transcript_1865/g.3975 Transcript_1865/m.3975 type:complete len:82 (-) Transcript_1865:27-272(-)